MTMQLNKFIYSKLHKTLPNSMNKIQNYIRELIISKGVYIVFRRRQTELDLTSTQKEKKKPQKVFFNNL